MLTRKKILFAWVGFIAIVISFFLFNPNFAKEVFTYLSQKNWVYLYTFILILGILRSFTFIPVTYLIVLGLLFVPATPLYFLIITGIMFSSLSVYYFFEYLHIDKMLERKYHKQIETTKYYMNKYELPVIILWAMNPILPSDIICYVSGTLRVNVYKFALGMLIGEGSACAIYIFGGKYILNFLFGITI
jgi:uncharacterized membrane protein YdjX (TVP38/TMEM64 family)